MSAGFPPTFCPVCGKLYVDNKPHNLVGECLATIKATRDDLQRRLEQADPVKWTIDRWFHLLEQAPQDLLKWETAGDTGWALRDPQKESPIWLEAEDNRWHVVVRWPMLAAAYMVIAESERQPAPDVDADADAEIDEPDSEDDDDDRPRGEDDDDERPRGEDDTHVVLTYEWEKVGREEGFRQALEMMTKIATADHRIVPGLIPTLRSVPKINKDWHWFPNRIGYDFRLVRMYPGRLLAVRIEHDEGCAIAGSPVGWMWTVYAGSRHPRVGYAMTIEEAMEVTDAVCALRGYEVSDGVLPQEYAEVLTKKRLRLLPSPK